MTPARCTQCGRLGPADDLLIREDTGEPVCPDCSGLVEDEDLGCRYDETG